MESFTEEERRSYYLAHYMIKENLRKKGYIIPSYRQIINGTVIGYDPTNYRKKSETTLHSPNDTL